MKRLAVGILAHVDSGKTTLTEAMLFETGAIRRLGRVDHGDAFLDTDPMERERGITIFSKQAEITLPDTTMTLLDTPGHADFVAETERVLPALDYAILVVSGTDGPQGHTETLWHLLEAYRIPTFIFVNKMDMAGAQKAWPTGALSKKLSEGCVDFSVSHDDAFFEQIAMLSEPLMQEYLDTGTLSQESLQKAIKARTLFPCMYGSALKIDGIGDFLAILDTYMTEPSRPDAFGAVVYKITEDERGVRLTHIKITGGTLRVRDSVETGEKIAEIRRYSGAKYRTEQEAFAGTVCAVTGLSKSFIGQRFGTAPKENTALSEPVLSCRVRPINMDDKRAFLILQKLEQEENKLHAAWNERLGEITVCTMGEVQQEILARVLKERFGLLVTFEEGTLLYKETIAAPVEGVGHFEPLRHYAEVHLWLEPKPLGSGLVFTSDVREEDLARNWQRLILTHLAEKTHIGVLTGSPITDMKITLKAGRAHLKHTEGGDFRQATYRAVRQGLRSAQSVLLEPWASFAIDLPLENVGRAMQDIEQMGGTCSPPDLEAQKAHLTGRAPFGAIRTYHKTVTQYTHGTGSVTFAPSGYAPCTHPEEVIASIGYDADADIENTADSVFCAHGAGFTVPWQEVPQYMHLESIAKPKTKETTPAPPRTSSPSFADDKELIRIFERTYGKIERSLPHSEMYTPKAAKVSTYKGTTVSNAPELWLIDGYNVLFWAGQSFDTPQDLGDLRERLIERLGCFHITNPTPITVVFDAYKRKDNPESVEEHHGVTVVYTKTGETADAYIEKTVRALPKNSRTNVVTSDGLVQTLVIGGGARRVPCQEFLAMLEDSEKALRDAISAHNRQVDLDDPRLRDYFESKKNE